MEAAPSSLATLLVSCPDRRGIVAALAQVLYGDIAAVLSNHAELAPVAAQFGVPFHVFEKTAENKLAQEQKERALLEELGTDLVVLARYMQVMSESFCAAFSQRLINIHHS